MTRHFPVPDSVQQSQHARDQARNQTRTCAGDSGRCRRAGKHGCARYGGAYCDDHWTQLGITSPRPDPALTLDGLRQAAQLPLDVTPAFRTISDQRAEAKGQRVSSARRAAARGDNDPALPDVDQHTRHAVLDVIGQLARTGQPFSANEARPLLPPGLPASVVGACWSTAVRRYQLTEVARVRSTDPNTNGHRIPVWQTTA